MQFVFPFFLISLLCLLVPILIHLFYFRRFKKVYFSDIRFLKEVQEEKSTIEKLKKRLILASRLLALFFLVLAFSQPFLGTKQKIYAGDSAACVYIDNSYSMGLKSGGEEALSIAKSKAIELAKAFQSGDKFALLTNDMDGTHQRWMLQQDFIDAVNKVELSPYVKKLDEISKKQIALFQTIGAANKVNFFISDFQKSTLTPISDNACTSYFLPISASLEKNIYVDTCWFEQPVFNINATNRLMVRLRNSGSSSSEKMRITLKINEAVKAIDDIIIPAGGTVIDSFNFSITREGWQRGEVSFNDYPITFDDHFYFAFNVDLNEKVLSIEDAGTPNNIASIFKNDNHFVFGRVNSGQVNYSTLKEYSFIVLNQLSEISSGLAASLKEYLQSGGSIYIIPAVNASLSSYNAFLSAQKAGAFSEAIEQQGRVTQINVQEDIFKNVFTRLPKNLETPLLKKYYPISAPFNNMRELLSTSVGTPMAAAFNSENGLIYLQSVPLEAAFSNLQSMPLFPPMIYNAALLKRNIQTLYCIIGKDNIIELKQEKSSGDQVFTMSNGQHEFIPENRSIGNSVLLRVSWALPVDGYYTVSSANKSVAVVAFNFDRSESVLSFATREELKKLFKKPTQFVLDPSNTGLTAAVKKIKDGVLLWKLCVILALVFLLIEILLIRYFNK